MLPEQSAHDEYSQSAEQARLLPLYPWLRREWGRLVEHKEFFKQFMMFCLVGLSGVAVNSLVMWGMHDGLAVTYTIASVIAYVVASLNNFTWNKIITFKNRERGWKVIIKQYVRYLTVCLAGMAINLGVLVFLVELWQVDPVPANLGGVLMATAVNFLGNKFFAFKKVSVPRTQAG